MGSYVGYECYAHTNPVSTQKWQYVHIPQYCHESCITWTGELFFICNLAICNSKDDYLKIWWSMMKPWPDWLWLFGIIRVTDLASYVLSFPPWCLSGTPTIPWETPGIPKLDQYKIWSKFWTFFSMDIHIINELSFLNKAAFLHAHRLYLVMPEEYHMLKLD